MRTKRTGSSFILILVVPALLLVTCMSLAAQERLDYAYYWNERIPAGDKALLAHGMMVGYAAATSTVRVFLRAAQSAQVYSEEEIATLKELEHDFRAFAFGEAVADSTVGFRLLPDEDVVKALDAFYADRANRYSTFAEALITLLLMEAEKQ